MLYLFIYLFSMQATAYKSHLFENRMTLVTKRTGSKESFICESDYTGAICF